MRHVIVTEWDKKERASSVSEMCRCPVNDDGMKWRAILIVRNAVDTHTQIYGGRGRVNSHWMDVRPPPTHKIYIDGGGSIVAHFTWIEVVRLGSSLRGWLSMDGPEPIDVETKIQWRRRDGRPASSHLVSSTRMNALNLPLPSEKNITQVQQ